MTKEKLRVIIGKNIRRQREIRKLSTEEFAELLDLTPGFMGLVERGQRGATPINLYKMSEIFDTSIDELFSKDNKKPQKMREPDLLDIKRSKINAVMYDLTSEELEFVLLTIKSVKSFRTNTKEFEKEMEEDYRDIYGDELDDNYENENDSTEITYSKK